MAIICPHKEGKNILFIYKIYLSLSNVCINLSFIYPLNVSSDEDRKIMRKIGDVLFLFLVVYVLQLTPSYFCSPGSPAPGTKAENSNCLPERHRPECYSHHAGRNG